MNFLRKDINYTTDVKIYSQFGPPFLTTMFVSFHAIAIHNPRALMKVKYDEKQINMIHQDYLVKRTNLSIMYQVNKMVLLP